MTRLAEQYTEGNRLAKTLAEFAIVYANQAKKDHQDLVKAV